MDSKQMHIASLLGSYERIQVFFECGCGFYNDEWHVNKDVIGCCPIHTVKNNSISGTLVAVERPITGTLTNIDKYTGLIGII